MGPKICEQYFCYLSESKQDEFKNCLSPFHGNSPSPSFHPRSPPNLLGTYYLDTNIIIVISFRDAFLPKFDPPPRHFFVKIYCDFSGNL